MFVCTIRNGRADQTALHRKDEKEGGSVEMKKEIIAEQFMKGFDCSQVVLRHYAEAFGITQEQANKIGAGFGGGMGIGETCGALTGAMIVLGMEYGHYEETHMEQKNIMNVKREEFLNEFQKRYSGYSCKELLKHDISKPEEMQKILDEGLLFDFCPQLVEDVIRILDTMV
jgi:C_GCAxxG_C_C family probable redox protein